MFDLSVYRIVSCKLFHQRSTLLDQVLTDRQLPINRSHNSTWVSWMLSEYVWVQVWSLSLPLVPLIPLGVGWRPPVPGSLRSDSSLKTDTKNVNLRPTVVRWTHYTPPFSSQDKPNEEKFLKNDRYGQKRPEINITMAVVTIRARTLPFATKADLNRP